MLTFEFLTKESNEYIFAYYPEGDEEFPGKIGINNRNERRIIKESDKDIGKRYAYHAMKGIDISKKNGTIAWY